MEQKWFEMPEIRRRTFSKSVWVPLRAIHNIEEVGKYGELGHQSEFFGIGTLAVPTENRAEVGKLGWNDIGIHGHHSGYIQDKEYIPATAYCHYGNKPLGEHLVLEQFLTSIENKVWHLSQDLVLTLGLLREGGIWLRPADGYIKIAELHRKKDGSPYLIEIRASYLRDYLCARNMALYMTSYRDRREIVENTSHISWQENFITENTETDRWEGRITEIHEGGTPFGAKTAVFHVARTDASLEDDVPELNPLTEENTKSQSWVNEDQRRKLYFIQGELWRNEWLEPASSSPLIRGDKSPATVFFVTSIDGKQENRDTLIHSDSWLWFRPDVINTLLSYRGSELLWYSRDTGGIKCCDSSTIHFGINSIGLLNVYAKDIAMLYDWQQKIWAGYNVNPEGKVSEELLDSQMRADPANTQAPEKFLEMGLKKINDIAHTELGILLLKHHDDIPNLLTKLHRFRAIDKSGLYALAKDIARITADSIDTAAIKKFISIPKKENWGSLKSLQSLIALNTDPESARNLLTSLFGAYELRLRDAHLPSNKELDESLKKVHVNQNSPFIFQGYQLLAACVSSIYGIADALNGIHKKIDFVSK